MKTTVSPMATCESETDFYRVELLSLNHENGCLGFVRWLDEVPLIVEVEE
jgi:hypothetical protein